MQNFRYVAVKGNPNEENFIKEDINFHDIDLNSGTYEFALTSLYYSNPKTKPLFLEISTNFCKQWKTVKGLKSEENCNFETLQCEANSSNLVSFEYDWHSLNCPTDEFKVYFKELSNLPLREVTFILYFLLRKKC